jgi:hypothetical protein
VPGQTVQGVYSGCCQDTATFSSKDASVAIAYDAASQTYTITAAPVGDAPRTQSWGPAERDAAANTSRLAVYSKASTSALGNLTDTLTLSQPGTAGLSFRYTYVGGGLWDRRLLINQSTGQNTRTFDSFVYGHPTGAAAVPRSGTGSYLFDLYGRAMTRTQFGTFVGTGTLVADFAAGGLSLTGAGTMTRDGRTSGAALTIGGTGTIAAAGNAIGGTLTLNVPVVGIPDPLDGFYSGPFSGQFFGPTAQEVGGAFRLSGGVSAGVATGFFMGRALDTTATSLQQLTSLGKLNGITTAVSWETPGSYSAEPPVTATSRHVDLIGAGSAPYAFPNGDVYLVNTIAFLPEDKVSAQSDGRFTTFRVTDGATTYTLRAYRPGPTNDQLVLSYVSYYDFQRAQTFGCTPCTTRYTEYNIVAGMRTDPTTLPRSGFATYNGLIFGRDADYSLSGTAQLIANFGADELTGTLSPVVTVLLSGSTFTPNAIVLNPGLIPRVGPVDSGTNALIVGTFKGPGAGNYSAAFYGPAAEELGMVFTGTTFNPSSGSFVTLTGGVVAKR